MDCEINTNNDLLQEVVIGQSTFIPLSPTWLLETQGYNEQGSGEDIYPEIQPALVCPDDFLNNLTVTADTPKKADYVEDSEQLEKYFMTSFSDLQSDSEVSKKNPEKPPRKDVASTSEGIVVHAKTPLDPPNKHQKSEKKTSQKTAH